MIHCLRSYLVAATVAIAAVSTPAAAEGPLAAAPMSDAALNEIRGTFWSYSTLSSSSQTGLDDFLRSDTRFLAGVGGIVMDNWWSEIGAGLIVANGVR